MISFLKNENDEGGGFMGKGDIIFLLVIASVIGGFWFYSKTIKQNSIEKFAECSKVWDAKDFAMADRCYEEARALSYLNDSLDSVIYIRSESMDSISDSEDALWLKVDSAMVRHDSLLAANLLSNLPKFYFLDTSKVQRLQAWQTTVKIPTGASVTEP